MVVIAFLTNDAIFPATCTKKFTIVSKIASTLSQFTIMTTAITKIVTTAMASFITVGVNYNIKTASIAENAPLIATTEASFKPALAKTSTYCPYARRKFYYFIVR
ncbi:MAG TPA: hypothetical protein IAD46_00490 [Candidatus Pelethenecus faecipullorum]|uniref:Uncharacterized protein n=1 Tax=Candidatus Pelethenecus faecipullorum TaxID=2840900 RepID=A0A9D1GRL1_9MOLU|nr:hypothetical protein [Candidatus Pelethenecus faecipullorum]